MKKIFLGLLIVPGIAFGMDNGANENSAIIDAAKRYNEARAATQLAYQNTEQVSSGSYIIGSTGLVFWALANNQKDEVSALKVALAGCCCRGLVEGYNQYYALAKRRARNNLAQTIRNPNTAIDMAAFDKPQVQAWVNSDLEIKQAVQDRKAIEALSTPTSHVMQ